MPGSAPGVSTLRRFSLAATAGREVIPVAASSLTMGLMPAACEQSLPRQGNPYAISISSSRLLYIYRDVKNTVPIPILGVGAHLARLESVRSMLRPPSRRTR